jgi:4-hydroxy-tetrahydrodipicolinate reductase
LDVGVICGIDPVGIAAVDSIDVCSTAMTPWVWPHMSQNPPSWIDPITEACDAGEASCFTTGIDPRFANDLFPMTLVGLCSEVREVRALEILDYINYEGDYEVEMGIGMPSTTHRCSSTPRSWLCRGVGPFR